jgi:hypothetical protein
MAPIIYNLFPHLFNSSMNMVSRLLNMTLWKTNLPTKVKHFCAVLFMSSLTYWDKFLPPLTYSVLSSMKLCHAFMVQTGWHSTLHSPLPLMPAVMLLNKHKIKFIFVLYLSFFFFFGDTIGGALLARQALYLWSICQPFLLEMCFK